MLLTWTLLGVVLLLVTISLAVLPALMLTVLCVVIGTVLLFVSMCDVETGILAGLVVIAAGLVVAAIAGVVAATVSGMYCDVT